MSERIDIAELERLNAATSRGWYVTGDVGHCGDRTTHKISPQFSDRGGMSEDSARVAVAARNALPALLRLARAVRAEHDLAIRREVPSLQELAAAAGEIDAALAAFDFGATDD